MQSCAEYVRKHSYLTVVVFTILLLTNVYLLSKVHSLSSGTNIIGSSESLNVLIAREIRKHADSSGAIIKSAEPYFAINADAKTYPSVQVLGTEDRKRILVTGGAGFVGSNLVDRLMKQGHEVIVIDNFFTGRKKNIQHWIGHPHFDFHEHDVVDPFMAEVDQIYHLACPASPPHYQYNPIKTIKTSTIGTLNMLGLAKRVKARLLFTSTSEIYGDPLVHPQQEDYFGNVNTLGPRSCYDEAKRVSETMCYSYNHQAGVETRIARIFNTFGPRMHPNDGRVVSNFVIQAIKGEPITIYGSGEQTRSFQYVDDLVTGLIKLMNSNTTLPVNLGNPDEYTMNQFAEYIKKMVGSKSEIRHIAKNKDDPSRRKPDITRAKELLNWKPQVTVEDGLKKTIEYFKKEIALMHGKLPTLSTVPLD